MTAEILKTQLNYSAWASARLLKAACNLAPAELERDFLTADKSVLGTLVHIFAADRVWFHRVQGTPRTTFIDPEDRSLPALLDAWPIYHEKWQQLMTGETAESILREVAFTDLKGNRHVQPFWQIVLHLVNHGTHHRGQVSGFIRSMGEVPPQLDLIFYYREMNQL